MTELVWEDSLQRLISKSPEIAAAFSEVDRARWAVNRAYVKSVPDVNVQAIIQHDNSTGSSNGSILVSIPIPVFNRNQGGIRRAESDLIASEQPNALNLVYNDGWPRYLNVTSPVATSWTTIETAFFATRRRASR